MHLLLLSISLGAVPQFLEDSTVATSRRRRIGYIEDAAVGMPFAARELEGVRGLGHEVVVIRARDFDAEGFGAVLDSLDAVYVAGGRTFVLIEALRSNGTADVLAARVRAGLPYIGCSAGSVIAGPSITPLELLDDRAAAPDLQSDEGLGLIDRVIVPHADGQLPPFPRTLIERVVSDYEGRFPLLLLRDDQAVQVRGECFEVIASK